MIHAYRLNGYNIVLDICSGAIHAVDDACYAVISGFKGDDRKSLIKKLHTEHKNDPDFSEKELNACYDEVLRLISDGQLFSPDRFEPAAESLKKRVSGHVKALCLHVSHACNLNCSYCFASQGKYHGERAVMPYEIGKQALDFLVSNSGSHRNLEVDFFGGEPLLNFDVVKKIVAYARGLESEYRKNFRFTLTTNGVLIDDDVIEFCNREMSNVVHLLSRTGSVSRKHWISLNLHSRYFLRSFSSRLSKTRRTASL